MFRTRGTKSRFLKILWHDTVPIRIEMIVPDPRDQLLDRSHHSLVCSHCFARFLASLSACLLIWLRAHSLTCSQAVEKFCPISKIFQMFWAIRSSVRLHRSLICLLRTGTGTASFACALLRAHSIARSLTHARVHGKVIHRRLESWLTCYDALGEILSP